MGKNAYFYELGLEIGIAVSMLEAPKGLGGMSRSKVGIFDTIEAHMGKEKHFCMTWDCREHVGRQKNSFANH